MTVRLTFGVNGRLSQFGLGVGSNPCVVTRGECMARTRMVQILEFMTLRGGGDVELLYSYGVCVKIAPKIVVIEFMGCNGQTVNF